MSIYLLRAGKWEGLYAMAVIESAVLRKQPKPEFGQYPKKIIMDDSNSTSCCFCHRVFERLAFPMHSLVKGCCAHVAAVLWYLGYQRQQTGEVFFRDKLL